MFFRIGKRRESLGQLYELRDKLSYNCSSFAVFTVLSANEQTEKQPKKRRPNNRRKITRKYYDGSWVSLEINSAEQPKTVKLQTSTMNVSFWLTKTVRLCHAVMLSSCHAIKLSDNIKLSDYVRLHEAVRLYQTVRMSGCQNDITNVR